MSKQEWREWLAGNSEAFGNATLEMAEIEKLQAGPEETDLATITVGCGTLFTIVCC